MDAVKLVTGNTYELHYPNALNPYKEKLNSASICAEGIKFEFQMGSKSISISSEDIAKELLTILELNQERSGEKSRAKSAEELMFEKANKMFKINSTRPSS